MSRTFAQQLWDYPIPAYDERTQVPSSSSSTSRPELVRETTPVPTPRVQPTSNARHSEFIARTIGDKADVARTVGVVTPEGRYLHPLSVPSHTIIETKDQVDERTGALLKRTVEQSPDSITVRVPVRVQRGVNGQYVVIEQDWRALSQRAQEQQQQQHEDEEEAMNAWRLDTVPRSQLEEKTLESDPLSMRAQDGTASAGTTTVYSTARQHIPQHPSYFPDLGLILEDVHTRHTASTGVGVRRVTYGSVAALSGLKVQDHIVSLQGEIVRNVDDFRRKLDKTKGTVWVSLNRDGRRNITVTIVRA